MMDLREFTEDFIRGDFARKNIYSHLHMGFPIPVVRDDGLGIELCLHKLICTDSSLTMSAPAFKAGLMYPSGRIFLFSQLETPHGEELVLPRRMLYALKNAYDVLYSACGEIADFYLAHGRVTQVMLKRYSQLLHKTASDIGAEQWYGGDL